jgi:hypothetical protein
MIPSLMPPRASASNSLAYSCSTYCETMGTPVSGTHSRSVRAARTPSSRNVGRRTSTIATSGRSSSVLDGVTAFGLRWIVRVEAGAASVEPIR